MINANGFYSPVKTGFPTPDGRILSMEDPSYETDGVHRFCIINYDRLAYYDDPDNLPSDVTIDPSLPDVPAGSNPINPDGTIYVPGPLPPNIRPSLNPPNPPSSGHNWNTYNPTHNQPVIGGRTIYIMSGGNPNFKINWGKPIKHIGSGPFGGIAIYQ